jgi:hypothetical protein
MCGGLTIILSNQDFLVMRGKIKNSCFLSIIKKKDGV